jgi:putative flippase GtrA
VPATRSMAGVQPTASGTSNRFEKRLKSLRDHRALGLPVRFYFRRREQVLYLVVGGWNTAFGYGIWAVLQYLLGDHLHYLIVLLVAWPLAVFNAYLGYRYLVFRSRGPILRELPRFSLVYFLTLLANVALLPVALNVLPFNIYVIQAVLTIVVVALSYLTHRYYSFGRVRPRDAPVAPSYDPPAVPED